MSNADLISILINLAVGIYFAVFYPRSLKKRFSGNTTPRGFVMLHRVIPPTGWLIIALTILYAISLALGG